MKFIFTLLFFCTLVHCVTAQSDTSASAPNFTITTSDGVVRQLYKDYLNQGKSVVLHLFFIDCPICREMGHLLSPFYYEWGNGADSVEFITLSIRPTDSNEDIALYKSMTGHPFPAAGGDGGSVQAAQPYINNAFGIFTGTPTFVVIAPNGKVTYNPRGETFEATLDSIDRAIRRTGIEKPAVDFQHSGTFLKGSGSALDSAKVRVRSTDMAYVFSDSAGAFQFTTPLVARNSYRLQFEKDGGILNGITTFDVVKLQRHVLGLEPFTSPYQLLAADVDRSGAVTIGDILLLRKLVMNLETTLPNSSWIFLNGDYQFLHPEDPFAEVYIGDATSFRYTPQAKEVAPFRVIAIKVGDVNFSAR